MLVNPYTTTEQLVGKSQGFMCRVVSPDGSGQVVAGEGKAILPGDVSTIACTVYDQDSQTPGAPFTVAITSAAILSTLTVANNWAQQDNIGYNFFFVVPGSNFAVAGHTYKIVFEITTTGGTPLGWYHLHSALAKAPS
jgi:hypothetical protein